MENTEREVDTVEMVETQDTEDIEHVVVSVMERSSRGYNTIKQQRAVENLVETKGNVAAAMRMAGYAPSVVNNPGVLTKSKSFQDLLEKRLPERHLLKKHREFLDSKKIIRTYVKGDLKETTEETDANAVKALDMAYKLKGKYQEKAGNNVLVINVSSQSSDRYSPQASTMPVEESLITQPTDVPSE